MDPLVFFRQMEHTVLKEGGLYWKHHGCHLWLWGPHGDQDWCCWKVICLYCPFIHPSTAVHGRKVFSFEVIFVEVKLKLCSLRLEAAARCSKVCQLTIETNKAPKTNAFSFSYCICDHLLLWPCRWSIYRAKVWTRVMASVNWSCIWPSWSFPLILSPILHCEVSDLPPALLLACCWPHYVFHNLCHYSLHIWLGAFITWLEEA